MIISHRHRFVFFHLGKTGGSSVTLALLPQLGSRDVVIGGLEDALTHGIPVHPGSWSVALSPPLWPRLVRGGVRQRRLAGGLNSAVKAYYRRRGLSGPHATPAEVRDYLDADWSGYFKFAFVRNPWDWAVSAYFWTYRNRPPERRPDFATYLARLEADTAEAARMRRWYFGLTLDGRPVCDMVGRFENLAEDLDAVRRRIGFAEPLCLPHAKRSSGRGHYRDHYSTQGRAAVARLFADAIADYGYRF
ncbi:sulfotransferase family 2 domain-containing protein [Parasulfuritortus cantonensis]|uniref:sulfotransferase family 2 domain-containing protein n=1 Tax=Parasulfuritortus cantonensis TaxID=2528202 RepID=UPI00140439BB|nr:sulfotransferase family 2 domain-containing protein [Parasulfuritortus cantonensis]